MLQKLKPEVVTRVLFLHHKAFGAEDVPCKPCGGACCVGCSFTNGFLRLPEDELNLLKKEYNFDPPKTEGGKKEKGRGFLTDKGCALPLEKRSATCLGFICNRTPEISREWKQSETQAAYEICELLNWGRST